MPRKQRNELKAGIFVVAALVLLLGVILWVGASDLFSRSAGQAVFYSEISDGPLDLVVGGDVFLSDIRIGKIVSITPDMPQGRVYYTVETTEPQFQIYANGQATVVSGLIGGSKLAITKFGDSSQGLADKAHSVEIAGGVTQALNELSKAVDRELNETNPDSLLSKIKSMAEQLEAASTDIAAITKKLRPELDPTQPDTIAANLKITSKNLAETTTQIEGYAKKDLGAIMTKVRQITENLNVSIEKIRTLLVANSPGIDEMMDNMVAVSANLKAASTEIRRNPWRLFYKPDEQKMRSTNLYDASRAFDEGATQLNIAVTKLAALRGLDPGDPATQKEIQRVRKQLLDSFTKFKKVEEALWKEVSQ